MRTMGLRGTIRGKPLRTTISDKAVPCPLDHVNRQFHAPAPDRLWLADFTYVSTWAGFLYLAVVLDAWSRPIVGWAFSADLKTRVVLDAPDMARVARKPDNVVHRSDRGSQGGFKRSSQHLNVGGCDDPSKAPISPVRTGAVAVTGTAASSEAI